MFIRKNIIFFLMIVLNMSGCKEKISYGTSLSVQNDMPDSLMIKLYPKQQPFSFNTEIIIKPGKIEKFFYSSAYGVSGFVLLEKHFDSLMIRITDADINIKFSEGQVSGYRFNPYIDSVIWKTRLIEAEEPDNFNRHKTITENYYFLLSPEYLEQ